MTMLASTEADVLVVCGITGDLAKKQTFRALYRMERRAELQCPVVGVARYEWSAATLPGPRTPGHRRLGGENQ